MLRRSLHVHRVKLPGRKHLDDVCKLDLLMAAPAAEVANIWISHHAQFAQYWGRVISTAAYNVLQPRLNTSRYFIVPVFRDKGIFNAVTNYNAEQGVIGVTPLQEWQNKGDHAQVHMLIQFFTELASAKDLVLVRCELQDKHMTRQDCALVTSLMLKFYTVQNLYDEYVETFNKRPNSFDYHAYLRCIKDDVGKDRIRIEDKVSSMRSDAYSSSSSSSKLSTGGLQVSVPVQAAPMTEAGISLPTPTQQQALQRSHDKARTRD